MKKGHTPSLQPIAAPGAAPAELFVMPLNHGGGKMKSLTLIIGVLFMLAGCATGSMPTAEQLSKEHFTECPANYQLQIQKQLSSGLFDPYSAVYAYSVPEKFVYQGNFGHRVFGSVNAKNRLGGVCRRKSPYVHVLSRWESHRNK